MSDAAAALVDRLLGGRSPSIRLEALDGDRSRFTVSAADGVLHLGATEPAAFAAALRHYLAEACGLSLAAGEAPELPDRWPDLEPASRTSPWRWRYHLNYCTFGYTTAYWNWSRWEQEIDQMALAGVNLPLATVGFEGVWLKVLTDYGLSSERARAYLGSAAFLPWAWMGCLHDHGSAMTETEIASRVELGRRILDRQRSLGMTPVLPGFTGYLPAELAGPQARPVDWMGFTNHCVAPGDPRYREFGLALLGAQREMFGSDGFYSVDPFIEGRPPVDDPAEVAAYAAAIGEVLSAHDPASVWVLQAWPFSYRDDYWDAQRTRAFLEAMPSGRSLILDLWAEHDPVWPRTEGFAGLPWLWTMLHSFGGRPGLHGALDVVATAPSDARSGPAGATLSGFGTAMESLGSDPIVYDLAADVVWTGRVDDLDGWLRDRVRRRYGEAHASLVEAWDEIVRICYRDGRHSGPPVSVVMSRPRVTDDLSPATPLNLTEPLGSSADLAVLARAWDALVVSATAHGCPAALQRDIVEVGLDVLARLAGELQQRAVAEFGASDREALARTATTYADTLIAMDRLAATDPAFRLDEWVRRARSWAGTPERADELERDARRLLTCWVDPGHVLNDYAGRHWAGLLEGFYLPRWQRWFGALLDALTGDPLDPAGFERELSGFEQAWLDTPYRPAQRVSESVMAAADAARDLLLGRHNAATLDA